ncbi:MAG: virulence RhuM family protein [Thermodesulfobacteriota bacterium]|nr:virulence RhuM family protein [Thermodesulfobacteriota bacterium]
MTDNLPEKQSDILIYQSEDGQTRIDVRLTDETVWLTQKLMAALFQKNVRTINEHIKNIYEEGELKPGATIRKFRIVQKEGKRDVERLIDFYNLDVIISVGYRVRSYRGTQFRIWATQRLKEYLIKGFVMDDERLKNPGQIDYFDELLERIRDIRASERRFYQKITDIYATSIDYDPNSEITHNFFASVQNKLHWAIHGHTAAELISKRVDSSKPNMGLTAWKGGIVRKGDVNIAKNYLTEQEISDFNLIVNQYLDFAEFQARRYQAMYMKDWAGRLDDFLQVNRLNILETAGKITAQHAKELAESEYEKFSDRRRFEQDQLQSDFDKIVKQIEDKNRKAKKSVADRD